jgi:SpoVK/Ycf46/Vps4 family AAA+-type ATPase
MVHQCCSKNIDLYYANAYVAVCSETLVQQAIGYVGADLAALAREAALGAAARTHTAAVAAAVAAAAAVSVSTGATAAAEQQPAHAANSHGSTTTTGATAAAGATAGATANAIDTGTVQQLSRTTRNSSNTTTVTPVDAAAAVTTAATVTAIASTTAAGDVRDDSSHSVQLCDFESAMERVGASSLRGHRVDVPQTLWEHIGGMDEVRHYLNFQNWLSLKFSNISVLADCILWVHMEEGSAIVAAYCMLFI